MPSDDSRATHNSIDPAALDILDGLSKVEVLLLDLDARSIVLFHKVNDIVIIVIVIIGFSSHIDKVDTDHPRIGRASVVPLYSKTGHNGETTSRRQRWRFCC